MQKLQSTLNYIEYNLLNTIASKNFYLQLTKKIQILKYFPNFFPFYKNTSFRYILYNKWIILYEIGENFIVKIRVIMNSKENLNLNLL